MGVELLQLLVKLLNLLVRFLQQVVNIRQALLVRGDLRRGEETLTTDNKDLKRTLLYC